MDHAERDVVKHILEDMLYSPIFLRNDVLDETCPKWLQENKPKVMKLVLDFLVKYRMTVKQIMRTSTKEFQKPEDMLYFLIFNECYDSQLEQWIELFEFVYPEENAFVKLFKDTVSIIRRQFDEIDLDRQWVEGRIGNTLKILGDTGRNKVLEEIARLVLVREPQAFRQFYGHFLANDEMEMTPATIHLLLVRDSYGMTRLHRAIFYEDTETVDRLLDCLSQSLSSPVTTSTAEQVMNNVMLLNDEGFTPFYVAAAYLHEELCNKILTLFKNVLTTDQLQTHLTAEKMKLVYGVLWDAVKFHKIQMFTTILTSVKHVLGQNYLLEMLSSKIAYENRSKTVFKECREKVLFKAMTDIVLKDDDNGFQQLNDLFFKDGISILSLEYVDDETFKQMLAMIGSDNWCLKLLRHDICTAFYLLSSPPCELVRQLQQDQLLNLLKLITTTSKCTKRRIQQSYWNRLLLNVKWWKPDFEKPMDDWTLMEVLTHFLNHTFGKVQENYIIELFFDDKGIELVTRSLLQYGKNSLTNGIFKHLTEEIRKYKDIKRHLMGKMPKIIRDVMKPIIHFLIDDNLEWSRIKVLDFVMDHAELTTANGDCSELSTLINTILVKYNNNVIKKASIWGEYFRHFDDELRIGNPTYRLKIWTDNVKERSARVCAFLKCVSEKLGSSKVKELLTHTHGRDTYDISYVSTSVISLMNLKGHNSFVEAMLTHLNEEDRIQVRLLLGRDQTDAQVHSASSDELAVESNDDSSD
jgi:ATP-dependent Clp protease adapter protein ClpS